YQPLVAPVIAAEFAEIVGVALLGGKQLGKARHAGVDRIPHGVNDLRVRQREMNEPEEIIVRRHLVGDALQGCACLLPGKLAEPRDIISSDLPQGDPVQRGDEFWIWDRTAVRATDGKNDVI